MKTFSLIVLVLVICWSCSQKTSDPFELVWSDEFDYNGLPDSTKWAYDTVGNSWGWGNRELQYYTVEKTENARVSNGTLKITARQQQNENLDYTSARLITKHKGDWLYGKFEVKAKLPEGRGLWPAIWMLPTDWQYGGWPQSGEIDIMENVGYDPDTIVASIHTASYNHKVGTQRNNKISIPDNRNKFHIYMLQWDENTIKVSVDRKVYFVFNKDANNPDIWPFDKRFHLLLNLAVGGDWGGMYGVDSLIFPATFEIDYVRVYQLKEKE